MAGLLYFLPGADRGIKIEQVRKLGLGYAFEDRCTARGVSGGPGGAAGVVIADDGRVPPERIGYYPGRQRWRPIPKSEVQVGMYTDQPPGPEGLARSEQLPGHLVKLGDGGKWRIPVALAPMTEDGQVEPTIALPTLTDIDTAGEWILGGIAPNYEHLWLAACKWWNAKRGAEVDDGAAKFDGAALLDTALAALASNYRVGKIEVALLGLFDMAVAVRVCDALIDWPAVVEFLGKKEVAGGSSIADGRPAEPADTGQR